MAAYSYVADKQGTTRPGGRKTLADVAIPTADSRPWEMRLRKLIGGIDTHLRRHPGSPDYYCSGCCRPTGGWSTRSWRSWWTQGSPGVRFVGILDGFTRTCSERTR